jgi:hypothetical protein
MSITSGKEILVVVSGPDPGVDGPPVSVLTGPAWLRNQA